VRRSDVRCAEADMPIAGSEENITLELRLVSMQERAYNSSLT